MGHSIIVERKGAWEVGRGRERVALIKSLITRERKDSLEVRFAKDRAEFVSCLLCDVIGLRTPVIERDSQ